jgi:hypothetical protein
MAELAMSTRRRNVGSTLASMFLEPRTLQRPSVCLCLHHRSINSPLPNTKHQNLPPSHHQPIHQHASSTWRSSPSPAYGPHRKARNHCARTRYPAIRIYCCPPYPASTTDAAASPGPYTSGPWSLRPDGIYRCVSAFPCQPRASKAPP